MTDKNSPDLCTKCGVCCDGTFFDEAMIQPSDLNPVTEKLDLLRKDGKIKIKLPCSHHINYRCTIYEQRPWVCRAYECKLLKECKQGKVDEGEAIEVINTLKSAVEEIDEILEKAGIPKGRLGVHKRITALEEQSLTEMTLTEYRKANGPLLIKYRLLQKLLTERFGIPFEKKKQP